MSVYLFYTHPIYYTKLILYQWQQLFFNKKRMSDGQYIVVNYVNPGVIYVKVWDAKSELLLPQVKQELEFLFNII